MSLKLPQGLPGLEKYTFSAGCYESIMSQNANPSGLNALDNISASVYGNHMSLTRGMWLVAEGMGHTGKKTYFFFLSWGGGMPIHSGWTTLCQLRCRVNRKQNGADEKERGKKKGGQWEKYDTQALNNPKAVRLRPGKLAEQKQGHNWTHITQCRCLAECVDRCTQESPVLMFIRPCICRCKHEFAQKKCFVHRWKQHIFFGGGWRGCQASTPKALTRERKETA